MGGKLSINPRKSEFETPQECLDLGAFCGMCGYARYGSCPVFSKAVITTKSLKLSELLIKHSFNGPSGNLDALCEDLIKDF